MRSQNSKIIDWLATGRSLTPIDALRRWGCFRLGARVWDLKRQGHRIHSSIVERAGKRFASYRLAK